MSLDEIVADTDDGLYLASNRSWSIDDRRLNFQFATEVAYEIKGGKKGRLFKNPTYTGITYEFWRSCDAVGDESSYVMLGTPNCGKGEPGQGAPRRPRLLRRPVPRRPGRGRQVVSATDVGRPTPLAIAERAVALADGGRRDRGRGARLGRDAAQLTRFANSEIHQNVAETNGSAEPPGRDRQAGRRRVVEPPRRRGPAARSPRPPSRSPATPRSSRTGAGCPDPTPIRRAPGRLVGGHGGRDAGAAGRGRPGGHRRRRRGRRPRLRLVLDVPRSSLAVANSHGIRAAQRRTTRPAPDRDDGRRRRLGLRRAGRRSTSGRSTRRRSGARRPTRRGRRPTRSRSSPATGRSCSRSTPSSTSSRCSRYMGFSALAVQEERSFAEPGKVIGSELVTIVDDATEPGRAADGLRLRGRRQAARRPRRARRLPRRRLGRPDRRPRPAGQSTGHGLPAPNSYGPFPLNMVMSPGPTDARRSSSAGWSAGLLVTRFHYTNPVHPKLAIVTGMTRDGTFLVEGGRIVGPVRNLRFTQSYLAALAGTVGGRPRAADAPRRLRRRARAGASGSTAGRSRAQPSTDQLRLRHRLRLRRCGAGLRSRMETVQARLARDFDRSRAAPDQAALGPPLDRRGPARHRRPDRDPRARLRLRDRPDRPALGGPRRRPRVLHGAVRARSRTTGSR